MLVDSATFKPKQKRALTIREPDKPSFTICANHYRRGTRARIDGTIKKLTPRAYARLQTFPDDFQLPDGKQAATHGIGNAVPPLMAQKILESV